MAQSTPPHSGSPLTFTLLVDFIDELRDSGYNIGVHQYIAVQDLLVTFYGRADLLAEPERLKAMLGPLLCTSPSEQAEFPLRFDQWLERIDRERKPPPALDYQANLQELEQIASEARRWRIVLRILLILLIPFIVGPSVRPTPNVREEIQEVLHEGAEIVNPALAEPIGTETQTPSLTLWGQVQRLWQLFIPVTGDNPEHVAIPVANQPGGIESPRAQPRSLQDYTGQLTIAGCLVALALGAWRLWWLYKAHRFLTRHADTELPDIQRLHVARSRALLFEPLQLAQIARDFRQRTDEPSTTLHIGRTVERTIRAGGWLTPHYKRRHAPPEYLMLVDRAGIRDHQSHYATELTDLLQDEGVFATVLYFDSDPRRCVPNNEQESPLSLDEMTAKYSQHRLVLVTDAAAFFDPLTGLPEPWLELFSDWSDRALMTPVPVMHWGYHEQVLAEHFIVLPATTDGLAILVEQLQRGQQAEALVAERKPPMPSELLHRPLRWLEREPPAPALVERMLPALKEYLGFVGYTWLCACAVYPALEWNLTLYLGNAVGGATHAQQLASTRVLDLARLPWFRYGYMPDWLRILLIGSLPGQIEQRLRRSLNALLISAIQGGDDSFALEIAQNKSPVVMRLGRSLHWLLGRNPDRDSPLQEHVYMQFMAGRRRQLAVQLPHSLANSLFTRRFFRDNWQLGLRWFGANLIGGIALALFLMIATSFGISTLTTGSFSVVSVLGWIGTGSLVGFCQWLAIRNHIPVRRSWIGLTTVGIALGIVTGIMGPLITPVLQVWLLRPFTNRAWYWLVVNIGGWLLAVGVAFILGVPPVVLLAGLPVSSIPDLGQITLTIFGSWAAAFVGAIAVYSWLTARYLYRIAERTDPMPVQREAQPVINAVVDTADDVVAVEPDRGRVLWWVLAPGLLSFVLLFGWPIVNTLFLSFQEYNLINSARWIGLQNFIQIVSGDELIFPTLGRTLLNSLLQVIVVYLVWLVLNGAWQRQRLVPTWVVLLAVLPIPFFSPAGTAILWQQLANPNGQIGRVINWANVNQAPQLMRLVEMLHTLAIAAAVGLLLYALLQQNERRGNAGPFPIAIRNVGMAMAATVGLQSFHWSYIITNGGPAYSTWNLMIRIYNDAFRFFEMGYSAALATIVLLPILILVYYGWRWLRHAQPRLVLRLPVDAPQSAGRFSNGLLLLACLPGLIIISPYILAPLMLASAVPIDFSTFISGIGEVFALVPLVTWLVNSVPLGLMVWLLQIPIALATAYAVSVRWPMNSTRQRFVLLPLLLAAMTAQGVVAVPFYNLLRNLGLINTLTGVVTTMLFNGTMVLVFVSFFDGQQAALANARQAGQSRFAFFRRGLLPLLWPLVWTVGVLAAHYAIQQFYWPLILLSSQDGFTVGIGMVYLATAGQTGTSSTSFFSSIYAVYVSVLPFALVSALILAFSVPRLIRTLQLRTQDQ